MLSSTVDCAHEGGTIPAGVIVPLIHNDRVNAPFVLLTVITNRWGFHMAKASLKLVSQSTEVRTVTLLRVPNKELRTREYLTEAEVDQPDSVITQVREACGAGWVRVNGVCVARTDIRQTRRAARRCLRYNAGVCAQWE